MNKRIIKLVSIIFVIFLVILVGFRISRPLPCSYINFAWGAEKKDCECLGIMIDTSCRTPDGSSCPDAGSSTGCIGIVKEYKCYQWDKENNSEWKQIPCNK